MTNLVQNDFDGDGRSDVLWRDYLHGDIQAWTGTPTGDFTYSWSLNWGNTNIAASGDFNGDGREDFLLWSADASGASLLLTGLKTQSAGFQPDWESATMVPAGWHLAGAGDFNGDGKTDILLRNDSGAVTDWLVGRANSAIVDVPSAPFVPNDPRALANPGTSWHVVGTGDFNGDGRADIFWQNDDGSVTDWISQADGSFSGNHLNVNPGTSWHVVGTGDFNGDGRTDVLWRNDNGAVTDWLAQADGTFVGNHLGVNPGLSWHVVGIGDYNGDGRDDLLWQNNNAAVTDWIAQADGSFVGNHLLETARDESLVIAPFVHDPIVWSA